jgi:hypothetical protein
MLSLSKHRCRAAEPIGVKLVVEVLRQAQQDNDSPNFYWNK